MSVFASSSRLADRPVSSAVLANLIFKMLLYMQTSLELTIIISYLWLARSIIISFLLFCASMSCSIRQGLGDSCSPSSVMLEHHPCPASAAGWCQGQLGTAICARGLEIHLVSYSGSI